MSSKFTAFIFLFIGATLASASGDTKNYNWQWPSRPSTATSPCPLVAGCTAISPQQCQWGFNGLGCDVKNPSHLAACHWPPVTEFGSGCTRVGITPDCACSPAEFHQQALPACTTIWGCTAASTAMCNAGPSGAQCDISDHANNMQCHWPAATSGVCTPIPGVPDCICEPPTTVCPMTMGCTHSTPAMCITGNGMHGMQCDRSDYTLLSECHWPAAATGSCSRFGATPDCLCENA